jgi:hypothetical protein
MLATPYRGAMRAGWHVAVLVLLVVLLGGCQLKKSSSNCVNDPGVVTGGTSVCTKPPPTNFNQLGQ